MGNAQGGYSQKAEQKPCKAKKINTHRKIPPKISKTTKAQHTYKEYK